MLIDGFIMNHNRKALRLILDEMETRVTRMWNQCGYRYGIEEVERLLGETEYLTEGLREAIKAIKEDVVETTSESKV